MDAADLLKAVVLGAVQGLTEFLPVSSTGHLIVVERWLGVSQETYGLAFDAAIHLGTLAALVVYFRRELLALAGLDRAPTGGPTLAASMPRGRLLALLIVGTIPAAVLGVAFESQIEDRFRSDVLVAVTLAAFSAIFVLAERLGRQSRAGESLGFADAITVGLAQSVALAPGVSRSGITISAGMFRGLRRDEAGRFAFLLSMPVIAGAGGLQALEALADWIRGDLSGDDVAFFAVGLVSAAVVGYVAVAALMRYLGKYSLYPFVAYRVAFAALVIVVWAAG